MIRISSRAVYLFLITLFLLWGICARAEDAALKKITFLPQWLPQAQFAGYYTALEKGFYRRNGLDVTILQGGPTRSSMAYLREGKTDIATLWLSSALQLADRGVEVVNIGQMIPRSALVLVTKRSSGIRSPDRMNGVKVGLWPADFQIQPKAFFDKLNLNVRIVTTESPVNLFLRDGVEVASVMWYNEYHTLINSGLNPEEMTLFFFDRFDLNFPEDGLYVKNDFLERDPAAACAFVNASLEGWRYAFAHPEEALDLIIKVMEAAHLPANRVHQRWMLDRMADLMKPATREDRMGTLQAADYERVGRILLQNGLIKGIPPYESFFRKCITHD